MAVGKRVQAINRLRVARLRTGGRSDIDASSPHGVSVECRGRCVRERDEERDG